MTLSRRAVLAVALAPALGRAQGFAGMGAEAEGYAPVLRETRLVFPRDHGPHPEFRIEWWYVTAALTDEAGVACGVQWTLFRTALVPGGGGEGWDSAQLWFAHAAATTAATHRAAETFARGGVGQAGVTRPPFEAWIDDWRLHGPGDGFDALRMTARGADFAYDLALTATGPLVLHGEGGFSLKAERGQASHYYSQPFLRAEGTLTLDGAARRVTGDAWLDREWSSQPLDPDQTGWDWFSLVLADGARVMLYRIRHREGRDSFTGTWIAPDGAAEPLAPGAARLTPLATATVAGRETPVRWRAELPARGFDVTVAALNPQAWNALGVAYWEGPVTVEGSHAGRGYLEMTGY